MRKRQILTSIVAILLVTLVFVLVSLQTEVLRIRREIHSARDIARLVRTECKTATNSDVTNAVVFLFKLQAPILHSNNVIADFVERERKGAVREIIAHLRSQTGKDLGDNPTRWILEYGDPILIQNQKGIEAQ